MEEIDKDKLNILAGMGMRKLISDNTGARGIVIPNGVARIYKFKTKAGGLSARVAFGMNLRSYLGIKSKGDGCRVDIFYSEDKFCVVRNERGYYSCRGGYVTVTGLNKVVKIQPGDYKARWDPRISAIVVHLERVSGPVVSETIVVPKKHGYERKTATHDDAYREKLKVLPTDRPFRVADLPNPPKKNVWTRFMAEAKERGDVEHVGPCQYLKKTVVPFTVIDNGLTKEEEDRRRGEKIEEARKAGL